MTVIGRLEFEQIRQFAKEGQGAHRHQILRMVDLIEEQGAALAGAELQLDDCAHAILTAICSEDGLDAAAGEALLRKMNRWPSGGGAEDDALWKTDEEAGI